MTLLKFPIGMENMGSLREHRMAHQDAASENEIIDLPAETPQERQAASSIDELKRQNTDLEAKLKASEEAKRKLTEEIQGIDARLKKMEASRDVRIVQRNAPGSTFKLREEVTTRIYEELMARHGASRGTSGVLRSQGTQYEKDAVGQYVSSRGKTVRADHLQSEAREKQRRVADAQARAAQLRRLDEDRHKPEYRSVLPEHRLRPGESMSWQEGQARLQEIYARRDGGTVVSPGYISYAPGQAQFRPDDDGGSYGTSSGIGRTDYDRQVKSPRYQAQINEIALRRSNDKILFRGAPAAEREIYDYFKAYRDADKKSLDPKVKDVMDRLYGIYQQLRPGSQNYYGDLRTIQAKIRSLPLPSNQARNIVNAPTPMSVAPSAASPRNAPSRMQVPEPTSSNLSSPISSPPSGTNTITSRSSVSSKARERQEQSGHAVRIDVRAKPDSGVPIVVYDEEGKPQQFFYEPMGKSEYWSHHYAEIAHKYGIRFERDKNENTGVTHYVNAIFTQPGHYMVNGKNYELTQRGEWREEADNNYNDILRKPYIDLQAGTKGDPKMVYVFSESPRDTTQWDIGTANMQPGEIRSSPDGMYRVYKTSKGELRLVSGRAGPIEVTGRFKMDRQISLGRYNITQKEVDTSSPTQDRRRPMPAPPPPSKNDAANELLRNAAQQSQRESTIFSSNTNTNDESSESSTPPTTSTPTRA